MYKAISIAFNWTSGGSDLNPKTRKADAYRWSEFTNGLPVFLTLWIAALAACKPSFLFANTYVMGWNWIQHPCCLLALRTSPSFTIMRAESSSLFQPCGAKQPEQQPNVRARHLVHFLNRFPMAGIFFAAAASKPAETGAGAN